jgi:deoxyribodipyrimidine photo-lyase
MHEKTLFIFRRDLRLDDNLGLLYALEHSKSVIPCFIFTPEQIEKNPYRGDASLQFMLESLEDLDWQLSQKKAWLQIFYGKPEKIVERCIKELGVDAVVVNRDYTPYSMIRDALIQETCKKQKVFFHSEDDALLNPPENALKADGTPYTVFTPYFYKASQNKVAVPRRTKEENYLRTKISFAEDASLYRKILPKRRNQARGGRKEALSLLKEVDENRSNHLSPHLKFTTISPREAHFYLSEKFSADSPLIRALYWRDFFSHIAFFFPKVFKGPFLKKFNHLEWNESRDVFKIWCEGKTGFPLVDASMRELNATGWMNNRNRMIVASVLVKDLHINWQWGERYFAQKLIDYDPAVNNGNWQWVAGTGCDSSPYFRVFNPWTQQKKFDPECLYIKKWVPELEDLPPKMIHNWFDKKYWEESPYPPPLVDHDVEAKVAIKLYSKQGSHAPKTNR